jgi:hypothetical protein
LTLRHVSLGWMHVYTMIMFFAIHTRRFVCSKY